MRRAGYKPSHCLAAPTCAQGVAELARRHAAGARPVVHRAAGAQRHGEPGLPSRRRQARQTEPCAIGRVSGEGRHLAYAMHRSHSRKVKAACIARCNTCNPRRVRRAHSPLGSPFPCRSWAPTVLASRRSSASRLGCGHCRCAGGWGSDGGVGYAGPRGTASMVKSSRVRRVRVAARQRGRACGASFLIASLGPHAATPCNQANNA